MRPGPRLVARFIVGTRAVDRAFDWFNRQRSRLIVTFASDETLDRVNELVYATGAFSGPGRGFDPKLFDWEERARASQFPRPPARILVGGAGSGRESLALAELGYDVVAFEPAQSLFELLATRAESSPAVTAFRATYEDLPSLIGADGSGAARLSDLAPFDASIFGWGSFAHLRNEAARVRALQQFEVVTRGPILLSLPRLRKEGPYPPAVRPGRLRRIVRRRPGRLPGDSFMLTIGYYRLFNRTELEHLAAQAGLRILEWSADEWEGVPYFVLGSAASSSD